MKHALILLAVPGLTACSLFGSLSEEEQRQVDTHRSGAGLYFNARQYEKAIDQAEKGLRIKPNDYDLRQRLGWAYIELAAQKKANNHQHLRIAEQLFAKLVDTRRVEDHDPRTIYGYAKTLWMQARVRGDIAEQLRREAKQPDANAGALRAQADEHERRSKAYLADAERWFTTLAKGDASGRGNRRDAYKYLMLIKYCQGDVKTALRNGEQALAINAEETKNWKAKYERTQVVDYERLVRNELAQLEREEVAIRRKLAAYLTETKEWKKAVEQLDAILTMKPNSFGDYYERGVCHRALNDHVAATRDFRKFLQLGNLSQDSPYVKDAYRYLNDGGK
ncbi:MAG: hypothetical protein KDC87_09800 [Planctomycetes bacterium]|nr:hypothetical protein [Planctomycetota bacterium]MCB9868283.1 hypothetical protein [Planctomycetota bacterium]